MCISLTPVLTLLYIVIIEVNLQGFTESVSLRYTGKPISRAQISSPNSLYLKAVKGAHIGSALTQFLICEIKYQAMSNLEGKDVCKYF